jgi:hypothetical protein
LGASFTTTSGGFAAGFLADDAGPALRVVERVDVIFRVVAMCAILFCLLVLGAHVATITTLHALSSVESAASRKIKDKSLSIVVFDTPERKTPPEQAGGVRFEQSSKSVRDGG